MSTLIGKCGTKKGENWRGKSKVGTVEGWKDTAIGECLSVLTDYTANGSFESLKTNVTYFNGYEYAVLVRTTDLAQQTFKPERFTDRRGYKYLKKTSLFGGEIVVANVGSVGKVYRVPKYDQPMTLAPNMYLLKFDDDVLEEYIFHYLTSASFKKELLENIGATTLQAINKDNLRSIKLSIPTSKPEQAKIAEILSTVDRAIEQTEALIAKQQRIKAGLMQDFLTRGIDEHGNLRSERTHQFKDSPLGRIPVEWTPRQIGSAATLQRGHDITEEELRDGPYPVVSSSGVIGYHDRCTSRGPNVVVGRKGTIGRVHYLEQDFWAHDTSLYVIRFRANNELYMFYLFSHLDLAKYGTKSGSPSLNRNDIHPLWFGLPPSDEQGRVASVLRKCDQESESLQSVFMKIQAFKTAIMQDLLTGNKRVTPLLEKRT
jgi:type I restriction enzyme S subunit